MHLQIKNVGPIADADIRFGDLTVFVGPQATGKSITLQFLKLMLDMGQVQHEMKRYGLDWSGGLPDFFDAYFGEGMRGLWRPASDVWWRRRPFGLADRIARLQSGRVESLFYIPAQRVLALRDGWPQPFASYLPGVPFVVREFSEKLRQLVDEPGRNGVLFPQDRRLKREFRKMLERDVFASFQLMLDTRLMQKRLVLKRGDHSLPFMVWSAGQREFVPLLLGLYHLMPPAKSARRQEIQWVVLEEIEAGLHPRAVSDVLLIVLELVTRGYRVCLSTHSPQVLETVWTLRHLVANGASPLMLLRLFNAPRTGQMQRLARTVARKRTKVYYFDSETGRTADISELDPTTEQSGEGGWGGLIEFSGRANEAVAMAAANANR